MVSQASHGFLREVTLLHIILSFPLPARVNEYQGTFKVGWGLLATDLLHVAETGDKRLHLRDGHLGHSIQIEHRLYLNTVIVDSTFQIIACVAGISGEGSGRGKTVERGERLGGGGGKRHCLPFLLSPTLFSSPLPTCFTPATQAIQIIAL